MWSTILRLQSHAAGSKNWWVLSIENWLLKKKKSFEIEK
jgi:hypothetical protein